MPGRRTSVAQVSFAATFELVTEFLKDLPMTVYSLTGFIGGSPSMVNPMMLVRSPLTGIVSFNSWFFMRSPYEMLFPPPETIPSLTESFSFGVPSRSDARSSRAW